jgi:hypothetical protein
MSFAISGYVMISKDCSVTGSLLALKSRSHSRQLLFGRYIYFDNCGLSIQRRARPSTMVVNGGDVT